METKFTKGNWYVSTDKYDINEYGVIGVDISTTNELNIITVWGDGKEITEVTEANAKLIAAAPDLLQSLYQILSLYEQLAVALPLIIKEEWYNKAKEAIKKATE